MAGAPRLAPPLRSLASPACRKAGQGAGEGPTRPLSGCLLGAVYTPSRSLSPREPGGESSFQTSLAWRTVGFQEHGTCQVFLLPGKLGKWWCWQGTQVREEAARHWGPQVSGPRVSAVCGLPLVAGGFGEQKWVGQQPLHSISLGSSSFHSRFTKSWREEVQVHFLILKIHCSYCFPFLPEVSSFLSPW